MAAAADPRPGPRAAAGGPIGHARHVDAGQPFASLVTPAVAPDLSVLLLLSSLAEHTRHLRADPRCALMVAGTPESANPQTAPRVTITGARRADPDPALKARWLAVHPYGALYADFADFAIWRSSRAQALLVGGFARAERLRHADLAPTPRRWRRWRRRPRPDGGMEPRPRPRWRPSPPPRATGGWWEIDVDGCDLAAGERVLRIAWEAPIDGPGRAAAELRHLAATGRWTNPG